jgi:hypothetical protein
MHLIGSDILDEIDRKDEDEDEDRYVNLNKIWNYN